MSAKKKTGASREELKREDILQALVIADSFDGRFEPLTQSKPRALLPLVNAPLIDYTLEFLIAAGIQEIVIFYSSYASQIKQFLDKAKWSSSRCVITPIVVENCRSMGDALREIDNMSLLRSDFVLVNGDLVSNMQLASVIEKHKECRKKEKNLLMTMVLKHTSPGQHSRCYDEEILLAIDKPSSRVLHYQRTASAPKLNMPLSIFEQYSDIDIRFDLLDCQVSICSPVVLSMFTDNFDYLTREDFIKGILINEEILGNTINAHVIEDEYAASVSNLSMYDAVSQDLICRWVYPFSPDQNSTYDCEDTCTYGRHGVYLENDVTQARGCNLKENVVIGRGTSVGKDTNISHSVIGSNCRIGENVEIQGAYIWDNVTIEDNCKLKTCLLADDVHIKEGVTIAAGSVISSKVVVGPSVELPAGIMLMSEPPKYQDDSFDEEDEATEELAGADIVGDEGVAFVYKPPDDSEDILPLSFWGQEPPSDDEEEVSSEESDYESEEEPEADTFYNEILNTIERAVQENIGTENIILEINSLKHAYGITIKEVNHLVTKATISYPQKHTEITDSSKYLQELKKSLPLFVPLLKNYMKSQESQMDALQSLEDCAASDSTILSILVKYIHHLYDTDVLTEEAIIAWFKQSPSNKSDDSHSRVRKQMLAFVTWLQEAEEETDSDSD